MDRVSSDFIVFPDPRLSMSAHRRPVDDALLEVGRRLLAAARRVNAYGLAAVHIGVVEPVVVVSVAASEARDYRVLYNPAVLSTVGPEETGLEGSVSMPGIEVAISRPRDARLRFDDESGEGQELALSGFAARVAQHEIDQMNGVFFLNRLSRLKRDAAIRRFNKVQGR
ncbi:peptide deformylase [Devosia crocina]|uniref:Peptide deformylase-like n=1 Tax=Devosia crocina TaxID=429728 RepID=A0A1I7NAC9_9HYPH|nr:peptide deformylase [Devosia crocina]SFV31609.1 peptide deformylase [Devosia crocina]